MKANATSVVRLLQGTKVFLIPTFQRRYTWKKEQWSQLWDDLLQEFKTPHAEDPDTLYGHFLGSVVLHPAPGPASTLMRHQVVDGQQRLTTILVLLAALRDVRHKQQPNWDAKEIDDQYLRNAYSSDYPERLVPTKLDREAYVRTVRHGIPTGDIGIAYNFFVDSINRAIEEESITLEEIQNTLLLRMLVVEITTKGSDSVHSIFNTLNSKGLDLSPADLVRNEMLHHFSDDEAEAIHEHYWIPMEQDFVNPRAKQPDREFVTFLWAREVAFEPSTTRDSLFATFERRFRANLKGGQANPQEAATALIREMYEDHKLFQIVRNPARGDNNSKISGELLDSLTKIANWGAEPATPISFWLLKKATAGEISQDSAARALHTLLSYLVKRTLNGIPTNQLNRLLTPLPHELDRAVQEGREVNNSIHATLSKTGYYWPSDTQILSTSITNPVYATARKYVKFLLSTAEKIGPGKETADLKQTQIEHIMPQRLSDPWREELSAQGLDPADVESLTHVLGNLTLTENNQSMGNASFADKKIMFFQDSALHLNRELSELASFGPHEIEARTQNLVRLLCTEFHETPLPAPSINNYGGESSTFERLESLLQTLPVDRWVPVYHLPALLGADTCSVREAVSKLDPTLAFLVRDAAGDVPEWLPKSLKAQVQEQEAVIGPPGKEMTEPEITHLAQAAAAGHDEDYGSEESIDD